jgi:four helix bundle protein
MQKDMRDYRKYDVWQKAHAFVLYVYKEIIPFFPKSEQYELASQLKRSAYSIPMNIAEGCGRNSDKDFAHFLDVALGSTHEAEYCSLLASELGFISKDKYDILSQKGNEVKAKLINLIKSIRGSVVTH